ncbi:hypothetical protein [Flavobacterium sp.]|jgi:fucose permease|uniref:hypothetical protein n=1 Tax=Flavobacterium sp. TaxID=239 RepID=UPI0022C754D2|nr:hypothetical protein [Flavobacterium sp.]MCZ8145580.1 hypothetical protein [Flavobacterium sp.]MCZ8366539.1 hypothetical protein [Flavobacterium sp.]
MNLKLNIVLEKIKILICIWTLETLTAGILSFFKSIYEFSNFFENIHDIVIVNVLRLVSFNWVLLISYLVIHKFSVKKAIIVDVSIYLICCLIFGLSVKHNWEYIWGYSFVSNFVSIAIAPFLFKKIILEIYENKFDVWVEN